jgi:peroxiredoxin
MDHQQLLLASLSAALLAIGLRSGRNPGATVKPPPQEPGIGKRITRFDLIDPSGAPRSLADFKDRKVLVLVFVGTTCPAANRSIERLSQMHLRYRSQGVSFLAIHANPDETRQDVARHAREYRFSFPVLMDEKQALVEQLQARVTPEAFVLDTRRVVRYRGRIDAAAPGKAGVRRGGLEAALKEVLAGKRVTTPVTQAAGCRIARREKLPITSLHGTDQRVTYHRDVEPILQRRCQSCHRPGQVAPFPLLTYAAARNRAQDIKQLTSRRQMPPWLAEPEYGDFEGSRRLSEKEIATLARWADAGAPKGDPKDAPPLLRWTDDWALGRPDLVLSIPEPYLVGAAGDDEFRVFVLPTGLREDRQVAGIEFRPGNPRVVHHLVSLLDTTGAGRALDARDPKPGYVSGPGGVGIPSAAILGLWTPGNSPRFLPQGVARLLPAGADLLLQVHYHKTGKLETDQTQVGLYFARGPVTREARTVIVGGRHEAIPAGDPHYEVRTTDTLPVDVRLLTIMPHMHLLGKEMRVTAVLPDGAPRDLVRIKKWDYRWQEAYRFKEPVALPRGTRVELVAYFDNSAGNPRNPHRPPQRVRFGELTTQEMASVILEGVVEKTGTPDR